MKDVAAVGDSNGDIPMLHSSGHGYWLGASVPPEIEREVTHQPNGDILRLAYTIVQDQRLPISPRYL